MKVCPSCGKSGLPFVGPFCVECFSKQSLVEVQAKNLEITLCPRCLRFKSGSAWVGFTPDIVEKLVVHKSRSRYPFSAKVSFTQGKQFFLVTAKFHLKAEGHDLVQERHFEIPLVKNVCMECNRQAGGYKEIIVQLRGDEKRAESALKRIEREIEGKTFWKTERKKTGGADLTAGSKNVVLSAVQQLRKPFSMSRKLMGVRDGKKLFLVTVLIEV